jgi:hypothetical protein
MARERCSIAVTSCYMVQGWTDAPSDPSAATGPLATRNTSRDDRRMFGDRVEQGEQELLLLDLGDWLIPELGQNLTQPVSEGHLLRAEEEAERAWTSASSPGDRSAGPDCITTSTASASEQ